MSLKIHENCYHQSNEDLLASRRKFRGRGQRESSATREGRPRIFERTRPDLNEILSATLLITRARSEGYSRNVRDFLPIAGNANGSKR